MAGVKERQTTEKNLAAIVSHPVRAKAFMMLAERVASPNEVAQALGLDINDVSYHVRKLFDLEMIELVDERPVRGAVEHFYRAIERPMVSAEEYAKLDRSTRNDFAREIVQFMFADVAAAIGSQKFSSRADNCVFRNPMLVDEEGWAALSALFVETCQRTFEIEAQSAERMMQSGEDGTHVQGSLLLYERETRVR